MKVEYYNGAKFEKWFRKLGNEKFQMLYQEIQLLAFAGNQLELPHSKAIDKGLFELRERKFGLRIYYTFKRDKIILLINGGDKSTQETDIKNAFKILKIIE